MGTFSKSGTLAQALLKNETMKTNGSHPKRLSGLTLADLIQTVSQITHNERLSAFIVADMINSRRVKIEGSFHGRRVVVC